MKKLIIFLGLILISATVFAQTARTADSHVLRASRTFYEYTGVAADTVGAGMDSLSFNIQINKNTPVNFNVRVEVTPKGSSEDYKIDLEGKVFENDSWVKIVELTAQTTSVTIAEPSVSLSDTSGVASVLTGAADNFYRYFQILIRNDGTCAATDNLAVDAILWKFYER